MYIHVCDIQILASSVSFYGVPKTKQINVLLGSQLFMLHIILLSAVKRRI